MTQQNTPEWHAARSMRVTTSLVPAILEISPYQSRDDALRRMVRQSKGAASEFVPNAASEYTLRNIDTAAASLELEHGIDVHKCFPQEFEDWAASSSQYETTTGDPIILRVPYRGGIKPLVQLPHIYARAQFEMMVKDKAVALVYQWTPEGAHLDYVQRDEYWRATAIPEIRQFHAFALSELKNPEHLEPLRVTIETKEAALLVAEYDEMRENRDRADERMKEIIERLTTMSNGKNALVDGRKLTKVEKEGAVSYARVVKEHCKGVDLEPYRGKKSESWRLT